jgi:hypothetical protein
MVRLSPPLEVNMEIRCHVDLGELELLAVSITAQTKSALDLNDLPFSRSFDAVDKGLFWHSHKY